MLRRAEKKYISFPRIGERCRKRRHRRASVSASSYEVALHFANPIVLVVNPNPTSHRFLSADQRWPGCRSPIRTTNTAVILQFRGLRPMAIIGIALLPLRDSSGRLAVRVPRQFGCLFPRTLPPTSSDVI